MTDPLFEIDLHPVAKGSRDAAQSLYRQLKEAILDGRLTAGAKLPPTRKSAAFFGASRTTAVEVYERLLNEGYVVSRHGSGTYVADKPPVPRPCSGSAQAATSPARRLNPFWLRPDVTAAMSFWREAPVGVSAPPRSRVAQIDFRPALIDPRLFPFDVFRRVSAQQLRGLEKKPASFKSPQGNQGNFHLREAITRHIALTRAVVCRPDDVLVTSGAQQAFDLLARALVTPGETVVAVEDPGYPPMRIAFAAAGARLVPVGVDDEGLLVEQLPGDVNIICVCPSHQFPLGVTMSARRRKALVAFARSRGAVIVEDDYDGEFRYDGASLQALQSADSADVVFYVGTFSKCMLPALRLGFLVAPEWAMYTLVAAKNCLDWHCATPAQLGVAGFISQGHLARHVRRMRHLYKQRRQALLTSLVKEVGKWLEPIPSCYGMHISGTLRGSTSIDLERVTETLLEHNIKIHSVSRYYLDQPGRPGLIFGYGAVGPAEIAQGLAVLRKVLS
jgi:GntR family transcriptional regulator / MocR family aminotransferase